MRNGIPHGHNCVLRKAPDNRQSCPIFDEIYEKSDERTRAGIYRSGECPYACRIGVENKFNVGEEVNIESICGMSELAVRVILLKKNDEKYAGMDKKEIILEIFRERPQNNILFFRRGEDYFWHKSGEAYEDILAQTFKEAGFEFGRPLEQLVLKVDPDEISECNKYRNAYARA